MTFNSRWEFLQYYRDNGIRLFKIYDFFVPIGSILGDDHFGDIKIVDLYYDKELKIYEYAFQILSDKEMQLTLFDL